MNGTEKTGAGPGPSKPRTRQDEAGSVKPSGMIPVSVVDRRRVGHAGDAGTATEPDLKPSYVRQLEERVRRVEGALETRLRELEADAGRSRQRLLKDLERRFDEKERNLMLEVLDILDGLDRAASMAAQAPAVAEGLALIGSRLDQFLAAHGCTKVSPVDDPFDPATMEAVTMQEGPEGRVVAVLQPAIRQGEVLLRPAKVAVGQGPRVRDRDPDHNG